MLSRKGFPARESRTSTGPRYDGSDRLVQGRQPVTDHAAQIQHLRAAARCRNSVSV